MVARILIVEDEQLVAADLEAKLHRMGHKVVGCVASGADAIRVASLEKPDLVLMDIRLQGEMDGVEAARRVQAEINTKIIFVSAFSQLARHNGGTLPPESCVTKPFSSSQLQAALVVTLADLCKADVQES